MYDDHYNMYRNIKSFELLVDHPALRSMCVLLLEEEEGELCEGQEIGRRADGFLCSYYLYYDVT